MSPSLRWWVAALVVVSACSLVTEAHRARVLEAPTAGGSDPARDRWTALVELERVEVLGTDRVVIGFAG